MNRSAGGEKGKKIPAGGNVIVRVSGGGEKKCLFRALFFVFDDDQFNDLISLNSKEIVQVSGIGGF